MTAFIGFRELLLLLVLGVLIFGAKRLPEVARSVGRGMRELKESVGRE